MLRRTIARFVPSVASSVMSSGWVMLWLVGLAACSEPPQARELPLEPIGDQRSVYGTLRVTPSARGHAGFTLKMSGLIPSETYILCLNAQDPGSKTSETLGNLGIPGWPLGAFYPNPAGGTEGFWDFEKVQANEQGSYERHFELPLPAHSYRIKFLVKPNASADHHPILTSQPLLLHVRAALEMADVLKTGTLAALAALPLVFMARGRGRRKTFSDAEDDAQPREQASEPRVEAFDPSALQGAPLDAPDATVAGTLVDRARAEGVLAHHKNYAWIEIHGRRKSFRSRQALVFRILCEQDPNCDGIPQDEIIKAWEEVFRAKRANPVRVRDIFRSCEHEPGDFIVRVPGPASVYRLRLEPTAPPSTPEPDSGMSIEDSLSDDDV
jgi:hypothetical protein